MKDLIASFIEFQKEVGPIHKESQAQYGKFADLQTVLTTVTPVLAKHGLCLSQALEDDVLITRLWHVSGECLVSAANLITTGGRGNALHTWGGAVTYQRRYSILSLLGLATEDDDGDSQGHKMDKQRQSGNDDFL